ncbi:MAG: efflux RND transporter periplasmic adaptor subunit [Candidatus Komeilibacteria bacterium]|nr:efflux RND transporter periplasmic adaptor subunit [Candidatus Komeilibacteria bacterium]
MIKNLLKKKSFWAIVLIVAIVVVVIIRSQNKPQVTYLTEVVKRADLVQTVSATGEVESATETNLAFKVSGRLVNVPVVVGTQVKQGQVLARLDAGRAASAVNQYRASVLSAQANLDKIKAGASPEDVAVSQQTVEQAELALSQAMTIRDQGIKNLKETITQKMQHSVSELESAIKKVKDLILEGGYSQSLGNLNIQIFYDTQGQLAKAMAGLPAAQQAWQKITEQSSQAELGAAATVISAEQAIVKSLLDKTYQVLLNTAANSLLPQATIDSQEAIISAEQTQVYSDLNNALGVAQAQFSLKTAQPRDFDVHYYEAALLQAQANLQAALADLADYSLVAPQDGVVTKVNNKLGEQTSPSVAVISMIAESNLQIKMDVPESDIAKVKVGNLASITLDAFGPDKIFAGHVTFVDPAATPKQDVVYYRVTVSFDLEMAEVKAGMTANVILDTAKKENVLVIPARSLAENGNNHKVVKILVNNQPQEKEVVIGLRGDEGLVEVVNGLEEGQSVITFTKEAAKK